jgi:hypothetical protein
MERTRLLQAVELLSKHADLDDKSMAAELSNAGFSTLEARLLVVLIPTAFSRPLLEKAGITDFAPTISAPTRSGGRVDIPLRTWPLYGEALALAREHYQSDILDPDVYKRVTIRSAEVNALNKALTQGEDVKGASIASAIVWVCAEDLGYEPQTGTENTDPWCSSEDEHPRTSSFNVLKLILIPYFFLGGFTAAAFSKNSVRHPGPIGLLILGIIHILFFAVAYLAVKSKKRRTSLSPVGLGIGFGLTYSAAFLIFYFV